MIKLPNFDKPFDYENNFYLSCDNSRIGKMIAHYELFQLSSKSQGHIIECGVFKGVSLIRFATFLKLLKKSNKKIIAFDAFGKHPTTKISSDYTRRKKLLSHGKEAISEKQLRKILKQKDLEKNIELIEGDITQTVPRYLKSHPKLKISLLNLDVDFYEPSITILKNFYPKLSKHGILMLDDYGIWDGETMAVNEYFRNKKIKIRKFPFSQTPSYIIKN
jgi:predicted O-methyltransferase YrrM|tara:strand:- start:2636 stop:3292 length:657 start_codon:yes stop_codon:yes gene_type:complete